MLPYSTQDVLDALHSCDNINAAVKSFLKREVKKGHPLEKFTKSFRAALVSGNTSRQLSFIEKNLPQSEYAFIAITRYALFDVVDALTSAVIEKHAEAFNETFENDGEAIEITDRAEFDRIANEAIDIFIAGLRESGAPASNYMLLVLIASLFDDAVVPEILPLAAAKQTGSVASHA